MTWKRNSFKHNTYTVNNTQLTTCFVSSEPFSGQFVIYRHGAFCQCAQYGIQYCLQITFILKFKLKIYWPIILWNICKNFYQYVGKSILLFMLPTPVIRPFDKNFRITRNKYKLAYKFWYRFTKVLIWVFTCISEDIIGQ
jgi:hypothetical protein